MVSVRYSYYPETSSVSTDDVSKIMIMINIIRFTRWQHLALERGAGFLLVVYLHRLDAAAET